MFADVELARRIERAETTLSSDVGNVARANGRAAGAFVEAIGGGVAVFTGPGSPVNKIIGVGFSGGPDVARLAELEMLFARRGSPVTGAGVTHWAPNTAFARNDVTSPASTQ